MCYLVEVTTCNEENVKLGIFSGLYMESINPIWLITTKGNQLNSSFSVNHPHVTLTILRNG